jgi:hypothetical protein
MIQAYGLFFAIGFISNVLRQRAEDTLDGDDFS